MAEWPIFIHDSWWASISVNEWFSLWDHCMVWGRCLHHSRKLQSPEKAITGWEESCSFALELTFIPTISIKADKLRKSVRSASYLPIQSRPLSLHSWAKPVIFQPSPPPHPPSIFQLRGQVLVTHCHIKLRIISWCGRSENCKRFTWIHLYSPRRQRGTRGHCWCRGSSSL